MKRAARNRDSRVPDVHVLASAEHDILRHLQHTGWPVCRHGDVQALCQGLLGAVAAADSASDSAAATVVAGAGAAGGATATAGAADVCAPRVVLLMADLAANCRAAGAIRALAPSIGLLAVLRHHGEHEQAALLLAGVDWFLQAQDQPARLTAMLRALHQRHQRLAAALPLPAIGPWQLQDHAWCLVHETGAVMRLTVSERALAACLFEAPGHVATHTMLEAALQQAWQPSAGLHGARRDPDLTGVVGRLRQKARQAGLSLPLGCLRGYGYLWKI